MMNGKEQNMKDETLIVDSSGNPLDEMTAAREAKEKKQEKKKEASAESHWARSLRLDHRFGYRMDASGNPMAMIYRDHHWQDLEDSILRKELHIFLSMKRIFSDKNVRSCMSITATELSTIADRHVPFDNTRTLISTKTCILEILEDGQIMMIPHDKSIYARVHVDVDLDTKLIYSDGGKNYYSLPSTDSTEVGLWGQLIKSSIPDPKAREEFQEMFGDLLSPIQRKAMIMMVGDNDSGKSQIILVASGLIKNNTCCDLNDMTGFNLENLIGRAMVFIDEVPDKLGKGQESIFKQLFGGVFVLIKRKHKSALSIRPDYKSLCGANKVMSFSEKTKAIETRLRMFKIHQPTGKKVLNIADRIIGGGFDRETRTLYKSQLQDVLHWCLIGAVAVAKRGDVLEARNMNIETRELHNQIVETSNPCLTWIDEIQMYPSDGYLMPKEEIYRMFKEWAHENGYSGHSRVSAVVFGRDYFARAMNDRFGRGWEQGLTRLAPDPNQPGRRVMSLPVVIENPKGKTQYVHENQRTKTLAQEDAYVDPSKAPESVKQIWEKAKKEAENTESDSESEHTVNGGIDKEEYTTSLSSNEDWSTDDVQANPGALDDVLRE